MNKRLLKYFWALPLLGMLSSCSESAVSEGSQNSKNGVYFAVTASKQTTTKAAAVDKDLVKNEDFGLFAYHGTDWATLLNNGTGPTIVPNFMNNQVVKYSNDGGWGYTPLMYWLDDKVSFFGYWPKEDGVTSASAAENEMPKVEFTQKMDAANMVDFITSYAVDKTKDGGKVTLDFHHVLTRLNFMARADRDLRNSGTSIYITGLRVLGSTDNNASKFFNKATFVLGDGGTDGDGHWLIGDADTPAPTKQADKLDVDAILAKDPNGITSEVIDEETSATYAANAVVVNEDGSETELLDKGGVTYADQTTARKQHYLFMIPPRGQNGIEDGDIMVELDYDVVIENKTLGNKGVVFHRKNQRVPLKAGTLVQGKPYNVVFTVGLNPVEVDVDVTDWDTDEIVNAPSVNAANTTAGIIAAWKKLNDMKASEKAAGNETANYFVINVDNMPTEANGNLNLRTDVDANKVDLSAFELGDQVELLFADDKDGTGYNMVDKVLVPNGWVCEDRMVNGVKRHIMTKVTNYITEVATEPYDVAKIITALSALNTKKGDIANKNIHYYAVNLYTTAPETIDLSSVIADNLSKFTDTNQDYLYIIYNTTDGNSGKTLTAPDGWTLTQTNVKGKYRLQRKVVSQTSNIAIGNTGFVAGSTINVSK